MKNRTLLMLAILTSVAGASAGTLRAAGIGGALDQGLGGAPADEKTATPKVEPSKDAKAPDKKPGRTDVINPDAANTVDSEDLVKKLTGGTDAGGGEGGAGEMLDEILTRMGDSSKRLHERDPGPVTQETQRRIIVNLEQLIEMAKQQQQSGKPKPGKGEPKPGQERQKNPGPPTPGPHNPDGTNAAIDSQEPGGGVSGVEINQTDIRQKMIEWGQLPQRERELIINGTKEEPLASYRDLVQRYYESLAEIGKTNGNR